jgi:CheY-like chemotaxis protein
VVVKVNIRSTQNTTHRPLLVVDDDEDIREALHELLALEGYAVSTARHGREALDMLRGGLTPSVILLDIMMPVMNGYEFLEERRDDPQLAQVPVIVMSAGVPRVTGVEVVLQKPLDLPRLLAQLGSYSRQPRDC